MPLPSAGGNLEAQTRRGTVGWSAAEVCVRASKWMSVARVWASESVPGLSLVRSWVLVRKSRGHSLGHPNIGCVRLPHPPIHSAAWRPGRVHSRSFQAHSFAPPFRNGLAVSRIQTLHACYSAPRLLRRRNCAHPITICGNARSGFPTCQIGIPSISRKIGRTAK
jgi:hypothetical protein